MGVNEREAGSAARNIVILGMHRSGTSMVAGALASAGVHVGGEDELLADQADNPLGFWERRDVVDFDEHLLSQSGGSWFNPPLQVTATSSTDNEIRGILARLPADKSWLLKDPRMVLTWPLWQSLLADPVVVFVYRSPLAVATSLQRRNGFPLSLGLALWEIYNQRALDALRDHDVASIAFESVLAAPDTALAALLEKLHTLGVSCETQPRLAAVDASLGKSGAVSPESQKRLLTDTQLELAAYCDALCAGEPLPSRPPLEEVVWSRVQDMATALAPLARVHETRMQLDETTRLCEERTAERDASLLSLRALEREHDSLADAHRDEVERYKELQGQHSAAVNRLSVLEQKTEALFVELSSAYGKLLAYEDTLLALIGRFTARCYKLLTFRPRVHTGYDDVLANARVHFTRHELSLPEQDSATEDKAPGKFAMFRSVLAYIVRNPAGTARSFSLPRLKRAAAVFMSATPEDLGVWIDSRFPGEGGDSGLSIDFTLDESLDSLHLVFPAVERPRVSVIVPVYNEYRMTVRCLRSVLENTGDIAFELIVADDCSSDLTESISERLHNVIHVRGESNQGFLRNCNTAAAAARGDHILLLNNDTVVCPDWLQPLLDVLDSDESVGIVGSKLLYPDGRLQEAGGIMWRDGSGWNFGRMDDPRKPAYEYYKEVDFVSGACLLIRRSLWQKLGGFDDLYRPAYYEDADLAFQAREAGYKVVYQPQSQVIHFEGVSNGTDLASGIKKYQQQNQKKFREKWRHELDTGHFDNAEHVILARDRSRNKRTVLFIDHYVPHYDHDAGSRSTFMYIQLMLDMGYRVQFMGANFFAHKPYTQTLQQMGVEVLVGEHVARNQDRWLQEHARYIDRIYLNRPHVAEQFLTSLHRMKPRPQIIFFGCDLHYLRINREYRLTGDEQLRRDADKWRKREFAVFDRVDKVYYPSQVEVDEILSQRADIDIRAIPLYALPDTPAPDYDFASSKDILFVGGFNHPPNIDAVCWFVDEVLPLVSEQCPEIRLHLVGSNPTEAVAALQSEQVLVYGYLSDEELAALYRRVRLAVVPLRFGAGIKGKVLEAIQQNVPLVTTNIGAEGIPEPEMVMNIADSAVDFAAAIIAVESGATTAHAKLAHYTDWLQRNFSQANAAAIIREDFGDPVRETVVHQQ